MTWLGWLLLAAALGGAAYLQYVIHRNLEGPSSCMGCGKCDKDGICVLTGKPVGPRGKRPQNRETKKAEKAEK